MKLFLLIYCALIFSICDAQTLPIDFESSITTAEFKNFDGGTATVLPNPQMINPNTSATVAQIVRNGGQVWGGSKIGLSNKLDFSVSNTITFYVFTTAPIGTDVKLKLEGSGTPVERDVFTTQSGSWELLTFDFTGTPSDFDTLVFMFDYGNLGNGSSTSTFLFDNINQVSSGVQLDLPVTFEGSVTNYRMTDFGGNEYMLTAAPGYPNNTVCQVIKTATAATWAGTTIGTPAGFASDIPLTLTNSKITAKIWSPDAGIPVRLKVEDSNDPTHTCETETLTTKAGAWEDLIWDFSNEAPGTAKLSFGLSNGWKYNMASIFFNFGTDGATAGAKTYYFDDVNFGAVPLQTLSLGNIEEDLISINPCPISDILQIQSNSKIQKVRIFTIIGEQIIEIRTKQNNVQLQLEDLLPAFYILSIDTDNGKVNKLIQKI